MKRNRHLTNKDFDIVKTHLQSLIKKYRDNTDLDYWDDLKTIRDLKTIAKVLGLEVK